MRHHYAGATFLNIMRLAITSRLITLARAAAIPARFASVHAIGVGPPDFHAVAEVFPGASGI